MEKIKELKKLFLNYNLDGYIIPKNDEFFGEYIPEHKDNLKFISNFSGSYGLAIILKNRNYLFVDGRYTLQAKIQSGKLFKIVTIPNKFPNDILKNKDFKIGYDPAIHTRKNLKIFFNKTNCSLIPVNKNLIDNIWKKKKKHDTQKFYSLPKKAVGENFKSKISKLLLINKKKRIDFQFITSSENIAWLLNIRGLDTEFTPIPNSYLIVGKNRNMCLFCDLRKITKVFKKKFKGMKIIDIKNTDIFLSKIKEKRILIDASTCSLRFENILRKNNVIADLIDPIYYLKSIKSKKEINNTIDSHIIDGVALTKFLIWLKNNYSRKSISEITAQEKLFAYRKKNKNFKFLSFPTISGSGPNGAIIHYKASKESNRKLKKGDIYLVDSGGQYNFGTTDVTRTISLENNNKRIKNIFTRVLKGHIAVANFKLTNSTTGSKIDAVARKYLKEINLDYAHGTGHGVGYFLNVHEGPQGISKNNKVKLREGMIISNEPGYYEKGKFGVRIENLIRVKKKKRSYSFDNLTLVPIDKSLIDKKILKKKEIEWLNGYHKKVFNKLKKFMSSSELKIFSLQCSKI